ncbi:MAG TPA: NAD(P)-dependent oxidoreductase [Burkholderiales bacterium]|nr:NAD(P)-dependent oxidoreductase [Burkholderiales bacterium]
MAVLVTGGSGFVGINVAEALLERGDDVVLFDAGGLPPGAERALAPHAKRLSIEQGSVLDAASLTALLEKHAIDRVIHAAAVTSGPDREARDPGSIVDVNLRGTINVLEAARSHGVQRVLYVGSGAAYGESLYRYSRLYESTPSMPTTLYSITKHAAERMCIRLKALWKLDIACARLGTVIGPWERDTGARDNFGTHSQLAAMAVAGKTAVLTSREIQRDWVYSRDVADALATLLHAPRLAHDVYNVSSGVLWDKPIERWCAALSEVFPKFTYRVADDGEQANIWYTDRDRGIMDVGRLAQDAGFSPLHSLEDAYAAYLAWMRRTTQFWAPPPPMSRA